MWAADVYSSEIWVITNVAGSGYSDADAITATTRRLSYPGGISTDVSGNFFFSDTGNNKVMKVSVSTGLITAVAGTGSNIFSGDGVPATSASLKLPKGLAVDESGNVFIADTGNHRIRKVSAISGIITTLAGTGEMGFVKDNVGATTALLNFPDDVAVDKSGNVFIADTGNNRIRKVAANTGIITTVAGNGMKSPFQNYVIAATAAVFHPTGVVVDTSGNIFIAEYFNSLIRKVTASTGIITTFAGTGAASNYNGDDILATVANLNYPVKFCLDTSGNIFISDMFNQRIRKITASTGIITTVAGSGVYGNSGNGGLATSATLSEPSAVAVDFLGYLYLSDNAISSTIRKVTFPGVTPSAAVTVTPAPSVTPAPLVTMPPTPAPVTVTPVPSATPVPLTTVAPTLKASVSPASTVTSAPLAIVAPTPSAPVSPSPSAAPAPLTIVAPTPTVSVTPPPSTTPAPSTTTRVFIISSTQRSAIPLVTYAPHLTIIFLSYFLIFN